MAKVSAIFMYDELPSYFDRNYAPFCGSLPDIIAVIAGIKPLTWVNFSEKNGACLKFIEFVGKHGVLTMENRNEGILNGKISTRKKVSAKAGAKTTKRLYLSKSKKILDSYRFGDPDSDFGKSGRPPENKMAALGRFAEDLGYPECCSGNYLKNGQRRAVFSYKSPPLENRAPFFLNNFLHSISNYYLSFHLPCGLECGKTEIYNKKIFNAIRKLEPAFAARLRHVLTMPLLVWFNKSKMPFDDRLIVLFEGSCRGNVITYSECFLLRTGYSNNERFGEDLLQGLLRLKDGDKLKNTKDKIYVYKKGKVRHVIEKQSENEGLLFHFYDPL